VSGLVQREAAPATGELAGLRARADGYGTHSRAALGALTGTVTDGLATVGTAQSDLVSACDAHDQAFATINKVLNDAAKEFKMTDELLDAAIGVAIGASMGLGIGEVAEGAKITSLAVKAAIEVAGEIGEAGAAKGVGVLTSGHREERDAALHLKEGLSPTVSRLEVYQRLTDQFRLLAEISLQAQGLAEIGHQADVLVGDIRVSESGGEPTRTTAELRLATTALGRFDQELSRAEGSLAGLRQGLATLTAEAARAKAKTADPLKLEQDLWIVYIADLGDEVRHGILDKIEDHLVAVGVLSAGGKANGRLNADFGSWTSEADTAEAGLQARGQVKDDYQHAVGPGMVGRVGSIVTTYFDGSLSVAIEGTRYDWDARRAEDVSSVQGVRVRVVGWDPFVGQLVISGQL
jgi:hypothetical protein